MTFAAPLDDDTRAAFDKLYDKVGEYFDGHPWDNAKRCIYCGAVLSIQGRMKHRDVDVHPMDEECNP